MASVKVAVRVRPLNQREENLDCRFIIDMEDKKTTITNPKALESAFGEASREQQKTFTYDHSYWSVFKSSSQYASQAEVFQDLGMDVIHSAYEGYNACVFAYGQTGSGKTYTMMGNQDDPGLIPRICEELFHRMADPSMTYRCEVSYLEIYNERVRDLIRSNSSSKGETHTLRVREHPKDGPYVQDLSKHIVVNYGDIKNLMDKGNSHRTTAATAMNDTSSRSHAIFTILFTQAKFSTDAPSETHSKIHLVDLAGSERADATGATGQRLKEGGSINKSLVTLGNVISTLADLSDRSTPKRNVFIPYRDSVLTWLLKDSLGGNSKTIMIAAISPADANYGETLSTLRYANRAKNIINKPFINEDANVKLIRDLRSEIARLKALLGGKSDNIAAPRVQEKLHENEARVKVLTEEWTGKWKEMAHILREERQLALRKQGLGVVLDSDLPHLIGIDDDILSTGIMLFHIKEGKTTIGTKDAKTRQDIVLQGEEVMDEHCTIEHERGQVTLIPAEGAYCTINGMQVHDPVRLSQGAVILLGRTNMFRFNNPAEAAKLRQEFKGSNLNMTRASSLSQSMSDLARSTENLALLTSGWEMEQRHQEQLEALEQKRQEIEEMEELHRNSELQRIAEQEDKEKELENKKKMLETLHLEAENKKKEATQMQEEMAAEKEKLKRRSMNLEETIRQRMEEERARMQQQWEAVAESQEASERARIRQGIEEEMRQLIRREQAKLSKAQQAKEQLHQEMKTMKMSQMKRKEELETAQKKLVEEKEEQHQKLNELHEEVNRKREFLQWERDTELQILEREREALEMMKQEQEDHNKLMSTLDDATAQRLREEDERVARCREEVSAKEKEMYEIFKKEQDGISERKERMWKEIQDKWAALKADKVYLSECEERYKKAKQQLDPNDVAMKEQLEKELIAIETEQERIEEDEDRLRQQEKDLEDETKLAFDNLRQKRDEQIDDLRVEKEKLKLLELERMQVIHEEAEAKNVIYSEKLASVEEHERELAELEAAEEEAMLRLDDDERRISEDQRNLEAALHHHASNSAEEQERSECQRKQLDLEADENIEKTKSKMKRLLELEERYKGLSLDDETQLQQLQEELQQLKMESKDASDANRTKPEEQKFEQKMAILEEQLTQTEAELEEKRQKYERERQEELDKIDWEKFKLQEMEEMERINALVEQEVKRRLLEERVQREKQRRIEREKERLERDQELLKIKKAHERELQRLKEKYESGNSIHVNMPTKANPYANAMTGDGLGRKAEPPAQIPYNPGRPLAITIPGYVQRGSAFDMYYEFEVKIMAGEDIWSIYRRYSRFRELHSDLREKFPQISALEFPPKKLLGNRSEKVVAERRKLLEDYLSCVLEVLHRNPACVLHPTRTKVYSKQLLHEFHPFFKKGLFEVSKHGTA